MLNPCQRGLLGLFVPFHLHFQCHRTPWVRSVAALLGCCCSSSFLLAGSLRCRLVLQMPAKSFASAELMLLVVGGLLPLPSAATLLSQWAGVMCPLSACPSSSQNHRMFGVGRDLCGSSSPASLPKQGHSEQAAEDLVQVGLEYLQRRRLHNLSEQPVLVRRHPQSEEVLPHVQTELPVLQFVPIAPCPVAGHH